MQTRTFSRISVATVIIVTIIVIMYGLAKSMAVTPFPNIFQNIASSTPFAKIATTTDAERQFMAIKTPKGTINAIVSSTSAERQMGLSGRSSLDSESGMLFIFPQYGAHGFWMKDMNFAIDIVWIDPSKTVIGVISGLSPKTFPQVYYPTSPVSYVLELRSGGALDYSIATGTKLVF